MGINLTCPKCGERMTFDLASTTVSCPHCHYVRSTGLEEKAEEIRAKGRRPDVVIANESEINVRAVSLFYTAHDYLFDEDKEAAIRTLKAAIDIQQDFLEAHLWIAKISDDETVKRDHLSSVLAYSPGHLEATRMMLVLNGRLTPEQAERSAGEWGPEVKHAEGPVNTRTETLRCPHCLGDLTVNDATNKVECRFCGYVGDAPKREADGSDSLAAALLERRAQAVKWVIGERLLHCNECGAERTIPATQLSTRCPFCNSNHVIEQDALGSFEQPDGLIPFKITREEAAALIKERLRGLTERVKGWFDNNKIASASLSGYYLPYWVFDVTVQINRTRVVNSPSNDRRRYGTPTYFQQTFHDALYDVAVCAVDSPPEEMTGALGEFHSGAMVDYERELLAKYPAGLYNIDFDRAALRARSRVTAEMRERYTRREIGDDDQVIINVFVNIQQMSFRLILMPVWVAMLVEEDRDTRMALVNGQSGKVVLGKTQKRKR